MKQIQIDLGLRFNIPPKDLTVNGLIFGLKESMPEIMLTIMEALFSGIEEKAINDLKDHSPERYVHNGHQRNFRQFRTSFGLFRYRMAQLYDRQANKNIVPLMKELSILPYRRYQDESLEAGVGLAVNLSYRTSAKEVERIRGVSPSKSTLHRRLQEFAQKGCVWPDLKEIPYRFLMVDGTGIKLRDPKKPGKGSNSAQMRWALASLSEGKAFEPVGFWVDKDWSYIALDLKKILDYDKLEVLFSDGGPGIEENLLAEGMCHQRCLLHGKRDFSYLLYADGFKKDRQRPFKDKLESIPGMTLKKSDLEDLKSEDLPKVKEIAEQTQKGFDELIQMLDEEKYPKARRYIQNLSARVTTFFDWWIEKKKWIPLTTNAAESAFSLVTNRIKNIGKRWGEEGLLNWLKVAIKKIFYPDTWVTLWKNYLNLNSPIKLTFLSAKYQWI